MNKFNDYRVSDLCEIISGGTPRTSNSAYWNGPIPWISIKDIQNSHKYIKETEKSITEEGLNNSSTHLLKRDDIIISARGTVGEMAMIDKSMTFNQSCFALRCKQIDPQFLFYSLKQKVSEIKAKTHGTVFNTIIRKTFDEIYISVPEDSELQYKIGTILSWLDQDIDTLSEINRNLEELGQILFNKYIINNSSSNQWKKESLLDIGNYTNGLAMQKYRPEDEKVSFPVLKIKELRQGDCDDSSERCTQNLDNKYLVKTGDLIFSWSGTLLLDIWGGQLSGLNQHLFKITSDCYDKWFLYYWTKHHMKNFINIANGKKTTMGHIKRSDLKNAIIFIPELNIYNRLAAIMNPLFSLIIKNKEQIRKLNDLLDFLLPKLISSEIDVSDLEIDERDHF